MSTKRGTRHLKRRNFSRVAQAGWAITFAGCVDESHLDEARKAVHDSLIEMTGRHRRGGIEWSWWPAAEAPDIIRQIEGDDAPRWQRLLDYLAGQPDGYLVMARCKAVPSDRAAFRA